MRFNPTPNCFQLKMEAEYLTKLSLGKNNKLYLLLFLPLNNDHLFLSLTNIKQIQRKQKLQNNQNPTIRFKVKQNPNIIPETQGTLASEQWYRGSVEEKNLGLSRCLNHRAQKNSNQNHQQPFY